MEVDWIPVEKDTPKEGQVVVCCGKKGAIYRAKLLPDGWWKIDSKEHFCNPVAWINLVPYMPYKHTYKKENMGHIRRDRKEYFHEYYLKRKAKK